MALAGNNGYGNFGYGNIDRGGGGGGGSFLNGINFLSGDFDVGIDGDLLLGALYLTPKVLCFIPGARLCKEHGYKKKSVGQYGRHSAISNLYDL